MDPVGGDGFVPVCGTGALEPGEGVRVRAGSLDLALFDLGDGRVYALEDRCPHAGGPLSRGTLMGGSVTCSWHCASFDLESGRSLDSISRHDAVAYPVRVRDGRVWVRLSGDAATPPSGGPEEGEEGEPS